MSPFSSLGHAQINKSARPIAAISAAAPGAGRAQRKVGRVPRREKGSPGRAEITADPLSRQGQFVDSPAITIGKGFAGGMTMEFSRPARQSRRVRFRTFDPFYYGGRRSGRTFKTRR